MSLIGNDSGRIMNVHASVGRTIAADCPVNSHNEWDPLEEIIVGRLEGSTIPSDHPVVTCNIPGMAARAQSLAAGLPLSEIHDRAGAAGARRFHRFARVARRQGDAARRGQSQGEILDAALVVARLLQLLPARLNAGDRRRDHRNARWPGLAAISRRIPIGRSSRIIFAAARAGPRRPSRSSPTNSSIPTSNCRRRAKQIRYILTEFEPVFDAADFFRCGRDLFVTRSNVTNAMGIDWLRRHLGDGYRIHEIKSRCPNPMHIDTTILPLGPGSRADQSGIYQSG